MKHGIFSQKGSSVNTIKIGQVNELFGDPNKKIEKDTTMILFPGGSIEIARTLENEYWVHLSTRNSLHEGGATQQGVITEARVNAEERYCNETNEVLKKELGQKDINHIAFKMSLAPDGDE